MNALFRYSASALAVLFSLSFAFALPTSAQQGQGGFQGLLEDGLKKAAPEELVTERKLPEIIGDVVSALMGLLGVLLFLYLLYGGFLWMTAGGEDKKVKDAKDIIRNAIIGLIIIALSYAIANFVIGEIGGAVSGGQVE